MTRFYRLSFVCIAAAVAACGTSPEFAHEPEVGTTPRPAAAEPRRSSQLPNVGSPPCGMSTPAVRAQARRGRYGGVEGFETRTCPQAGVSD